MALACAGSALGAPAASAKSKPIVKGGTTATSASADKRVQKLLGKMTLEQKITMIDGAAEATGSDDQYQAGYIAGIPSLGIPSLKLTDGPPGVATKQDSTALTDTMGVAASFSRTVAHENGTVIGRDARALGQDVTLEPFINIDRDTDGTRGWNTFGEDPLLTGVIGASEITGIQGQRVMADAKHYIAYEGSNSVDVDQQTLHEIYLEPFSYAVNAGVASIMCSYNTLNSAYACGNKDTLTTILRKELGFKGFVMSDWGADHGTDFLADGLDLDMPGSGGPLPGMMADYNTTTAIQSAVAAGTITTGDIDTATGRILYEYDRFGLLTGSSKHKVTSEAKHSDETVVEKTAEAGAVLLKNKNHALPLKSGSLKSIALIGPGAGQDIAGDGMGEKAGGFVSEETGTLQVLRKQYKKSHIKYAVADDLTGTAIPAADFSGLTLTNDTTSTSQGVAQIDATKAAGTELAAGDSYTWTGTLNVPSTGEYWVNMQSMGGTAALTVDGNVVGDAGAAFYPMLSAPRYGIVHPGEGNSPVPTTDGLANQRTEMTLSAGSHTVTVAESADVSGRPVQVRLAWVTPSQITANTDAAVKAAKAAKTAVVFAWDDDSSDLSAPLPESQDSLIEQIAKVNKHVIVVLNTGQPVAMPWRSKVSSVLEMWYPGDGGGYATASLLMGRSDPSGRLPVTWPKNVDQEVAHQSEHPDRTTDGVDSSGQLCSSLGSQGGTDVSTTSCTTTYSEGIDVGYRFFDATGEKPLYAFGYGLSYTKFTYSGLKTKLTKAGTVKVTFKVKNTGSVAGATVPQIYLGAPKHHAKSVQFAKKALAAFTRVSLAAGRSKTITLVVPKRQLQYWSTAKSAWKLATGGRVVYLASNERTLRVSHRIAVK
jgi:beta-glucosidase